MDIPYFVSTPGDDSIACNALFVIQGPNVPIQAGTGQKFHWVECSMKLFMLDQTLIWKQNVKILAG